MKEVTKKELSMNGKKLQIWLPLLFALVMSIGMLFGYKLRDNMGSRGISFFNKPQPSILQEVVDLIRQKYVDTISIKAISSTAIMDILAQLDPHSIYIPASELKETNDELQGNFEGIGIEYFLFNDTIHVIGVQTDGPAYKAGLETGDKFIKVNDSLIAGVHINDEKVREMLKGPKGTDVTVTILRNNNEQKQITITRGVIPVKSIVAAYMLDDQTGFIRINRFTAKTYEEFMPALEDLQKQGLKNLILDLRGNGGGILEDAVQIADEFIDDNKLIVYTEGKDQPRANYTAKRPGLFEKGKLLLLIDEGTASASEVLAGAVQDWDRATIIGRRSFGKGLVQEQYYLSDGSALRLTVARYYSPTGRSIQKPYTNGIKNYNKEIIDRFHGGEVYDKDSIHQNGKMFKTPGGKVVYGSGGITPDVFVPYDSSIINDYFNELNKKETVSRFDYFYLIRHKKQLTGYKSPKQFVDAFSFSENDWKEFIRDAQEDSVNTDNFYQYKEKILQYLKAHLAYYLFKQNGYFYVENKNDREVKKALEIINKN